MRWGRNGKDRGQGAGAEGRGLEWLGCRLRLRGSAAASSEPAGERGATGWVQVFAEESAGGAFFQGWRPQGQLQERQPWHGQLNRLRNTPRAQPR